MKLQLIFILALACCAVQCAKEKENERIAEDSELVPEDASSEDMEDGMVPAESEDVAKPLNAPHKRCRRKCRLYRRCRPYCHYYRCLRCRRCCNKLRRCYGVFFWRRCKHHHHCHQCCHRYRCRRCYRRCRYVRKCYRKCYYG